MVSGKLFSMTCLKLEKESNLKYMLWMLLMHFSKPSIRQKKNQKPKKTKNQKKKN